MNYKNNTLMNSKRIPSGGPYIFSSNDKTCHENEPVTEGNGQNPGLGFLCPPNSREVSQSYWRRSCLLLTQGRNTFAIQRKLNRSWIKLCDRQPQLSVRSRQHSVTSKHRNRGNSLALCGQKVFVNIFSWNTYYQAARRLDLSQEKLTQIPSGLGPPPQIPCWDFWVLGLKELESGIVT